MWCKLTSRVAHEHVDALLARADAIVSSSDHKETVNWDGKDFFVGEYAEDDNFGLLRLFHLQIWPEISNVTAFDVPVIDHASLLIKGAGAAGTAIHQVGPIGSEKRRHQRFSRCGLFWRICRRKEAV